MHELKKIGEVFNSKFVGTGPSSYKKRIYRAAISQRLRNTVVENHVNSASVPNFSRDHSFYEHVGRVVS